MLTADQTSRAKEQLLMITEELQKVVIGQHQLIRNILVALLAKGHVLLEGVPGLAKTLAIETLATVTGLSFSRIQFTPDLLPSDLLGTQMFDQKKVDFVTKKGPIFAHFILADEINRAPAKVQSALLEAMAERQITLGDEKFTLEPPFVVMATQNPLEQEGTYALPEAQLDRFLLKTVVSYPSEEDEVLIMKQYMGDAKAQIKPVLKKKELLDLQDLVSKVFVSEAIFLYIKNIVFATRRPADFELSELQDYIAFGASPRASLGLVRCAQVIALMAGREYVLPEDVKTIAPDVLRHRIILSFAAMAEDMTTDQVIEKILQTIPLVEEN